MKIHISIFCLLAFIALTANANTFKNGTHYQVCFTPGHDCTKLLTDQIDHAKKSIDVQLYSFTSYKIAKALVKAHERGVKVRVIADRSNVDSKFFSFVPYLQKHHIPAHIDRSIKGIAHNKVMIIDHEWVETGSFNFTKAAQTKNAENMLLINSHALAAIYTQNFQERLNA